jgi:hypothetical protein
VISLIKGRIDAESITAFSTLQPKSQRGVIRQAGERQAGRQTDSYRQAGREKTEGVIEGSRPDYTLLEYVQV